MRDEANLRPGTIFARDYRVLARLDRGGMGVIYRVEQISTGHERALKVLRPELLPDPASVERFAQEATVGSRIRSEHVVEVVSAGWDDDTGHPYLVMELLEGESLRAHVDRRGALSAAETWDIVRQLGHALAAAHAGGVVHRDLKPENIFLTRLDAAERSSMVKLLDFGLAKTLQESDTSVTSSAVMGSPLWMAPEQVRRDRVRTSTDVWALGLLVYWMLTGKHYWRSANTHPPAGPEEILHEKLFEGIESASRRARSLGVPHPLPPGFDAWFRRCVVRDPAERFSDATLALAALQPVLQRNRSTAFEPRTGIAIVGVLIGVAGLGGGWMLASRARREARAALGGSAPPAVTPTPDAQSTPQRDVAVDAGPTVEHVHRDMARVVRPRAEDAGSSDDAGIRAITPQLSDYALARREDLDSRCTQRATPAAFAAEPAWFSSARREIDTRARTVAGELRMAQSAAGSDDRTRLAHAAETSRAQLVAARARFEQRVADGSASERGAFARGARAGTCRVPTDGFQVEHASVDGVVRSIRVYWILCCPQ